MLPSHLYIHVPFCARRCSYCDFSIAVRSSTPVDEYTSALRTELATGVIQGSSLDTVYLGGGTPSRLGPDGIDRIAYHAIDPHDRWNRGERFVRRKADGTFGKTVAVGPAIFELDSACGQLLIRLR